MSLVNHISFYLLLYSFNDYQNINILNPNHSHIYVLDERK